MFLRNFQFLISQALKKVRMELVSKMFHFGMFCDNLKKCIAMSYFIVDIDYENVWIYDVINRQKLIN